MILAAAAAGSSGNITIPLSMLLGVLLFAFSSLTAFGVWIVKQVTLQSRFQAETSMVLRTMSERSSEDRARISRLEDRSRP